MLIQILQRMMGRATQYGPDPKKQMRLFLKTQMHLNMEGSGFDHLTSSL